MLRHNTPDQADVTYHHCPSNMGTRFNQRIKITTLIKHNEKMVGNFLLCRIVSNQAHLYGMRNGGRVEVAEIGISDRSVAEGVSISVGSDQRRLSNDLKSFVYFQYLDFRDDRRREIRHIRVWVYGGNNTNTRNSAWPRDFRVAA